MDNLEYIETYFSTELSPERKKEFEERIAVDNAFAEEVAFYLSFRQIAAAGTAEKKESFKKIYARYKTDDAQKKQPVRIMKFWPWVAAAAVVAGLVFGLNVWLKPVSPQRLADRYLVDNLHTLPVTMSNKQDSLQAGLHLYNENKLDEALRHFESMAHRDTSLIEIKKYAGIVSLRLGQYDKAINYFSQLGNYTQLYANPGKFYHALTLMKRNRPGDKQAAGILLKQVVQYDLEGKRMAQQWLRKW